MELTLPGSVISNVFNAALSELPLIQFALTNRLGCSDKAVEKQHKQGKEDFAIWSRDRNPDSSPESGRAGEAGSGATVYANGC
jgi:hypothetical protein